MISYKICYTMVYTIKIFNNIYTVIFIYLYTGKFTII